MNKTTKQQKTPNKTTLKAMSDKTTDDIYQNSDDLFGLYKDKNMQDGLQYQEQLREEWSDKKESKTKKHTVSDVLLKELKEKGRK